MKLHILNQLLAAFTAFLTIFQTGLWRGYIVVIISKLRAGKAPVPLVLDDIPWVVALSDFSGLLTVFPVAYTMERLGRLTFLRLAFILYVLGAALCLIATSPYHVYFACFLFGVGRTIGTTISPFYVAEIAQAKLRGALSSINVLMMTGSTAVTFTFGPVVSFRHLTWTTLVFPFAGLLLTFVLPESPYFCLSKNNEPLALRALSRLRDNEKSEERGAEVELIRKNLENSRQSRRTWAEIVSEKGNRKALMIVVAKAAFQRAGGWMSLTTYGPAILPANTSWSPNASVQITLWVMVVSSWLGIGLFDRLGRKPLQIVATLALALIIAVMAVFFYFYQKTKLDVSPFMFVPHLGLIVGGLFYPFGQTVNLYRGELLSPSIKGRASAVVSTVQLAISCVVNKVFFKVDQSIGMYFLCAVFSAFNFLDMLFTAKCIFETKGKTLADIQNLLKR